jgi:putative hemolysin
MAVLRNLEVRRAQSEAEIAAAQALRYRVFYDEMGARPSEAMAAAKRDFDQLDEVCDHLLVLDHNIDDPVARVVGTYRMNLQDPAGGRTEDFYSADEYDLTRLMDHPSRLLEVGRSCVAADYRRGAVMQLLWLGIAEYMAENDVGIMFGCASFPGADPAQHAEALSYLYHHHLAPPELRTRALGTRHVGMDMLPKDRVEGGNRASASLPPLIKAYLRLGGYVGDGAVIDHQFNTVDVCVIVEASRIAEKYYKFFLPKHASSEAA